MDRKKLLICLSALIVFIFLVHVGASFFYWYRALGWLDIFLHFLGGIWLSLAAVWLLRIDDFGIRALLSIIIFVLLFGVLWEGYELLVNSSTTRNPLDVLDTLSDLLLDLLGGGVGIFFVKNYAAKR